MKKDKLTDFIKVEKKAFEKSFDEEAVWDKIQNRIVEKPKERSFKWLAAASIVLVIAVAWLSIDRITLTEKVSALEQIMVEGESYSQIEDYYTNTISQKSQLVNEKAKDIDFPINEGIESLQKNYTQLKKQLKENGANERVINAMILNLRTQIDLLNEQLSIIESLNEYVKTENIRNHDTQI